MSELARNDAKGAAEAYRNGLLSGKWTLDMSRRLFAMQDNPDELGALVEEANKDPDVLAALRKLISESGAGDDGEVPESLR